MPSPLRYSLHTVTCSIPIPSHVGEGDGDEDGYGDVSMAKTALNCAPLGREVPARPLRPREVRNDGGRRPVPDGDPAVTPRECVGAVVDFIPVRIHFGSTSHVREAELVPQRLRPLVHIVGSPLHWFSFQPMPIILLHGRARRSYKFAFVFVC